MGKIIFEVKSEIEQARPEKALAILIIYLREIENQRLYDEAIMISSRLNEIKKTQRIGTNSDFALSTELAKINHSILMLVEEIELHKRPVQIEVDVKKYYSALCESCKRDLELTKMFPESFKYKESTTLIVKSIESKENGWYAKGFGILKTVNVCYHCNAYREAILELIPKQLDGFECPQCYSSNAMEFMLKKIETSFEHFSFEIDLTCKACRNPKV